MVVFISMAGVSNQGGMAVWGHEVEIRNVWRRLCASCMEAMQLAALRISCQAAGT